ncbi:hypothetical protein AB4Z46_30670 [Variovorax sp. M-6]|uniref:hypothetical protein n=1 Tax=Variovorax sp. M-6 TaxID=3233041 RepID=UPI003F994BED
MNTSDPTRVWFGEGVISPSVAAHLAKHAAIAKPQAQAGTTRAADGQASKKEVVRVMVGEGVISPAVQRHIRRS